MAITVTYADSAEYADFTGTTPPANIDRMLQFSSTLIREITRQAIYDTDDTTGLPTDQDLIDAFKRATILHTETLINLDINPVVMSAGTTGGISKKALGSASIEYAVDTNRESLRSELADGRTLSYEAYLTLSQNGLTTPGVVSDYPVGATLWVTP